MEAQKLNKKYLRQQTFWDCDFEALDEEKDEAFMINRVVHRGSDLEHMYLNALFGYRYIYDILKNYKGVDLRVLGYYKNMAEHQN